jgi:phage-related protein
MKDKEIIWLHGEIQTPPFSSKARYEAGYRLRQLQSGESLKMPYSRLLRVIGANCHELRIQDDNKTWRIVYHIDPDAILILEVFQKQSQKTPQSVIDACRRRLIQYDRVE